MNNDKPVFSIIIINYRTKELTTACLNSIFEKFSPDLFEIILIDNDSGDGSAEYLKNKFGSRISFIANGRNDGFGKANNIAAKQARGDILFFLNSDTLITADILGEVKREFEYREKLGALAPKLLTEDGVEQEYAYGDLPTLASLFKRGSMNNLKQENGQVDWLSGAALFVRKSLFDALHGFDDRFFMYFEDMDLCKRIKEVGYFNKTLSHVSLIHLGGKSAGNFSRKKMYYISQSYYFKKHYGIWASFLLNIVRWPYKTIKLMR